MSDNSSNQPTEETIASVEPVASTHNQEQNVITDKNSLDLEEAPEGLNPAINESSPAESPESSEPLPPMESSPSGETGEEKSLSKGTLGETSEMESPEQLLEPEAAAETLLPEGSALLEQSQEPAALETSSEALAAGDESSQKQPSVSEQPLQEQSMVNEQPLEEGGFAPQQELQEQSSTCEVQKQPTPSVSALEPTVEPSPATESSEAALPLSVEEQIASTTAQPNTLKLPPPSQSEMLINSEAASAEEQAASIAAEPSTSKFRPTSQSGLLKPPSSQLSQRSGSGVLKPQESYSRTTLMPMSSEHSRQASISQLDAQPSSSAVAQSSRPSSSSLPPARSLMSAGSMNRLEPIIQPPTSMRNQSPTSTSIQESWQRSFSVTAREKAEEPIQPISNVPSSEPTAEGFIEQPKEEEAPAALPAVPAAAEDGAEYVPPVRSSSPSATEVKVEPISPRASAGSAGVASLAARFPLKRLITKQRPTLEGGAIVMDDTVLQYLKKLEDHRAKCESEGRYAEARAAATRVSSLRTAHAEKLRADLIIRQRGELEEVVDIYQAELTNHNLAWNARIQEYESNFVLQVQLLKEQHQQQLLASADDRRKKTPSKARPTREYLLQKELEKQHAKQQEYEMATVAQKTAERLARNALEEAVIVHEVGTKLHLVKLRAKQQQEMEVLLQKLARGRDELELKKIEESEQRQYRFRNIIMELENVHKLELVYLENFLDSQVQAGKALPLKDTVFRRKREQVFSMPFY